LELQGQVAIVTGAGRGIGRATALELARMGADIVVAELDRANAERTASEVRGVDRRALAVPTDVTSRRDLGAMVDQTRAEFGRIDILVNNAGIYRAAETLEVTEEDREPGQPAVQRQQGSGHQHDQEPCDSPCRRWDPGKLCVPRLCGDRHVDIGRARTGGAA